LEPPGFAVEWEIWRSDHRALCAARRGDLLAFDEREQVAIVSSGCVVHIKQLACDWIPSIDNAHWNYTGRMARGRLDNGIARYLRIRRAVDAGAGPLGLDIARFVRIAFDLSPQSIWRSTERVNISSLCKRYDRAARSECVRTRLDVRRYRLMRVSRRRVPATASRCRPMPSTSAAHAKVWGNTIVR
jgi:hypothetical protein